MIIRNFSLYTQNKRWGTARNISLAVSDEGGEDFFEKGVWIGAMTTVVRSVVSVESFIPDGGEPEHRHAVESLLSGRYLDVMCRPIGEHAMKFYQMKPRNLRYGAEMVNGITTLSFELAGGAPELIVL